MRRQRLLHRRPRPHPRRRPAGRPQPRRADGRLRPDRATPRRLRRADRRGVPLHAAPRRRGLHRRSRLGPRPACRSRRSTCPATPAGTAGSASSAACSSCPTSTSPGSAPTTATCGATSRTSSDRSSQVRDEHADYYVTFHHKGVIEGRDAFVELLDEFHAVIPRRHEAMLEYLAEPHTIDDMVDAPIRLPTPRASTCSPTTSSTAARRCTCSACSCAAKRSRSNPAGSRPPDSGSAEQLSRTRRTQFDPLYSSIMRQASWLRWCARSCSARAVASSSPTWGTVGSAGFRRERPTPASPRSPASR